MLKYAVEVLLEKFKLSAFSLNYTSFNNQTDEQSGLRMTPRQLTILMKLPVVHINTCCLACDGYGSELLDLLAQYSVDSHGSFQITIDSRFQKSLISTDLVKLSQFTNIDMVYLISGTPDQWDWNAYEEFITKISPAPAFTLNQPTRPATLLKFRKIKITHLDAVIFIRYPMYPVKDYVEMLTETNQNPLLSFPHRFNQDRYINVNYLGRNLCQFLVPQISGG